MKRVSWLVHWSFTPSQLQRIISELKETFIKRYIVERTTKAEKDRKNRVRKRRDVGRIYGMKYSRKDHKKTETDTRAQEKGVGRLGWFMSKTLIATSPPREGESVWTSTVKTEFEIQSINKHVR